MQRPALDVPGVQVLQVLQVLYMLQMFAQIIVSVIITVAFDVF